MFGINNFSAIINPPQVCILAVGGSIQRIDEDAVAKMQAAKAKEESEKAAQLAAESKAASVAANSLPFAKSAAFATSSTVGSTSSNPSPVLRLPTSTFMTVTLVSDERAVDGEAASQFLTTFKTLLEQPNTMA